MKISDDKKVDILLLTLKERYESIHKIRERVQAIGVWTLGILLGVSGWMIQNDKPLTNFDKVLFASGIVLAFLLFQRVYLADLQRGFRSQQRAAVQIENMLKLYEKGFFSEEEISAYPERWKEAGTDAGDGKFFNSTKAMLLVGVLFLVLSIFFGGIKPSYCDQHQYRSPLYRHN